MRWKGSPGDAGSASSTAHPARLPALPDDRGVRPLLLALVDETFEIRCNTDHSGIIMQELLTGETDVGFILKRPAIAGIQLELLYRSPSSR